MILNLKEISINQGAVLPFEYALDLSDISFYNENPLQNPLNIKGTVSNHAGVLELDAIVKTTACYKCARCACNFEEALEFPIFHVLAQTISEDSAEETIQIIGGELDMDSVVRDAVILNMDMVHICKPSCKGLCPFCGIDLNEGQCDCKPDTTDSRLASLKQLLDNKDYQ